MEAMIVIPAIDLKDGRCVRLSQGKMDQESVYSEDPVGMAKHWESKGARRLHVVDLNGAVVGKPMHRSVIAEIVRTVRIPVEVGGGIRNLETIEDYLSMGVKWVILGTVAFRDPDLVREACRRFPGRVLLSIDAKGESVAIEGWYEVVSLKTLDLSKQFEGLGPVSHHPDGRGKGRHGDGYQLGDDPKDRQGHLHSCHSFRRHFTNGRDCVSEKT